MDSPQPQAAGLTLPPHHIMAATTAQTAVNHGLPGSAESSPKSSQQADWDEPLAPLPGGKLRLMCSYGGHIIPRPHDKSLCYVRGETRMIVVERNSILSDLISRLSKTLLDGRQFSLKYQLPNEELDSLISVTTDEDLENMVEEYDRIMAAHSPLKPSSGRLRLFLFFAKPETAMTMGALLDDAKSETWFVDALNGTNLPRGLSDSAAMDDLLSLGSGATDPGALMAAGFSNASAQLKTNLPQDIHSIQSAMPDSPMIETNTSSFDSSTSSPSMAHLPPIRVRSEEYGGANRLPDEMLGATSLEEQLSSQLRVTPPLPTAILTQSSVAATHATGPNNEIQNLHRVISEDERSEHGVNVALRKPPLPLPLQPGHQRFSGGFNLPSPDSKHAGGLCLPSPDSVKSDSSITSATSFSKVATQQDPTQVTLNENKNVMSTTTSEQRVTENRAPSPPHQNSQLQQMLETTYLYPPHCPQQQQDQHQHQYIQPNMHYIPSHTQVPSYYQVYATQQSTQPQVDHQQSQYPVYILPVPQTQPYNLPVQSAEKTTVASGAPPPSGSQAHPPVYHQTRTSQPTNNAPGMVQIAPNSSQYHQYVGHYNAASARPMPGNTASYANYDYTRDFQLQHQLHHQDIQQQHQLHHQVYYTGQVATGSAAAVQVAPSQYQSITPAQAAMIAEASLLQMPTTPDSANQPPRTS